MTDVEKSEILHIWHVCDVAIYTKFMQFSCGEKLSPKVHLWRKSDKYQVWEEGGHQARTFQSTMRRPQC